MEFLHRLIDAFTPPQAPDSLAYCRMCNGTGHAPGSTYAYWQPCVNCGGSGLVRKEIT